MLAPGCFNVLAADIHVSYSSSRMTARIIAACADLQATPCRANDARDAAQGLRQSSCSG